MDADDYYSIDAILAENQKIECTFKHDVSGLGYLTGGQDPDIKKGARVQLPYWLTIRPILDTGSADFQIPQPFSQRVQNALDADPRSVKLASLVGGGGQWYGFGRLTGHLLNDEPAVTLSGVISKTFHERLADLMDQAHHFGGSSDSGGSGQGGEDFREGLDATERELFTIAQESAKLTKAWYESTDKLR